MSILTTLIKIDAVNPEFLETCYTKNNILYDGTHKVNYVIDMCE